MMRVIQLIIFSFVLVGFQAPPALAANPEFTVDKYNALILPNIVHAHLNKHHFMTKKESPPSEPHFKKVKFLKQQPPKTLAERVDRIIHGIYIDIPPEYDHYGYEIRRSMKSILTPHDLNDPLLIPEKLENVRKARIILDYWKRELNKEMRELGALVDEQKTTINLKTTYRYNQRIVTEFIPVLYGWVDKNMQFLEYVRDINGEFYVNYPFYDIADKNKKREFQKLYNEREEALKKVITYSPFRAMIY